MEVVIRIYCYFFRMGTVLDPCHYQALQKTHVPGKLAHQKKCTSLPHIALCFQVNVLLFTELFIVYLTFSFNLTYFLLQIYSLNHTHDMPNITFFLCF